MATENCGRKPVVFPSQFQGEAGASPGLLFIRAYNRWHGLVRKALATCGLTHPQFVFMACTGYLAQTEEYVTQSMVSSLADMDLMTVSQLAVLLEKKGLISRVAHPHDSRAKSVSLSAEGQLRLNKSLPTVEAIDQEYFGALGTGQKEFLQMLHILSAVSDGHNLIAPEVGVSSDNEPVSG